MSASDYHAPRLIDYELGEKIASGGSCDVFVATHKLTKSTVAIKCICKRQARKHNITLEIDALRNLRHANIITLYQVEEYHDYTYLVLSYHSAGNLWGYLKKRWLIIGENTGLLEKEVRALFTQIVGAVSHLHESGYAHRDIKLGNIVLDESLTVKLADFGFAEKQSRYDKRSTKDNCGTREYFAPELLGSASINLQKTDMWSLGVVLYTLLTGRKPFKADGKDDRQFQLSLLRSSYTKPDHLSPQACSVLDQLLHVIPSKRCTCKQLLEHPWFEEEANYHPKEMAINKYRLDKECTRQMAHHYGIPQKQMISMVREWKYDQHTATYLLLLEERIEQKEEMSERDSGTCCVIS